MGADSDFSQPDVQWVSSQKKTYAGVEMDVARAPSKVAFWDEASPFQIEEDILEPSDTLHRFVVRGVETRDGSKVLVGRRSRVVLSGAWAECEFAVGMRVRVFDNLTDESLQQDGWPGCNGSPDTSQGSHVFMVDDTRNAVLIEDHMLTVTNFCSALMCENSPLVNRLVADISFSYANRALVFGVVMHELLQICLVEGRCDAKFITTNARAIIEKHERLAYACNVLEKELLNEVLGAARYVAAFVGKGIEISAVEQGIFSCDIGLKGSIDCYGPGRVIEFKTGKRPQVAHRAQVLLYTLLMLEREGRLDSGRGHPHRADLIDNINTVRTLSGAVHQKNKGADDGNAGQRHNVYRPYLYYLCSEEMLSPCMKYSEIAALLQLRNKVAARSSVSDCLCAENMPCSVYRRLMQLPETHFLRKQLDGIESEYVGELKFTKAIVTDIKNGVAVLRLTDDAVSADYVSIYSRTRKLLTHGTVESVDGPRMSVRLRDGISVERMVYISTERCEVFYKYLRWSLISLAYPKYYRGEGCGALSAFTLPGEEQHRRSLAAAAAQPLNEALLAEKCEEESSCCSLGSNFTLDASSLQSASICDISESLFASGSPQSDELETICSFEGAEHLPSNLLDSSPDIELSSIGCASEKEETGKAPAPAMEPKSSIGSAIRSAPSNSGYSFLDERLYNKKPGAASSFGESASTEKPGFMLHADVPTESFLESSLRLQSPRFALPIPDLFKDDFLALNTDQQRALFYALNCESYRIVHGMPGTGKSTLIALLIKILRHYGKRVLTICYTHFAIENIIKKLGSLECYRANYADAKPKTSFRERVTAASAVFGTCFCFGDPVFIERRFDYCIIDEGSQMHLLLALIPISLSARFCVVGDHLQLKPLAKHSRQMELSIFEHLMDGCSVLAQQYRMVDSIMRLSNTLFYGGRLVNGNAGSSAVEAEKALCISFAEYAAAGRGIPYDAPVLFIDTAGASYRDIVATLPPCVILCYLNATVKDAKAVTQHHTTTVDRFQGSESDCVAVVFDPVVSCEVLSSRERLNVALTRARKQLVLIGNRANMLTVPVLKELLDIL